MKSGLTHAIEDYLKTIYELSVANERVSTSQIAEALSVKPASVTGMLQKLAAATPPLVTYEKHRGVALTHQGARAALGIIRHHRLLETFLHETLGFDWDAVHAEADRLEHVISDEFEARIAEALGHPTHDPHGDPIPDQNLQMPAQSTTRLSDLRAGQQATIERVRSNDAGLLRHLSENGLIPGSQFTVLAHSPFDDNLHLQQADRPDPIILGPRITRQIFVELLP